MSEKFKSLGEFAKAVMDQADGGSVDTRLELMPIPLSSVRAAILTGTPPDHIVMTDACFDVLLGRIPPAQSAGKSGIWNLYGIPIEHYPTDEMCKVRAYQLRQEHGIRVMLVAEENT